MKKGMSGSFRKWKLYSTYMYIYIWRHAPGPYETKQGLEHNVKELFYHCKTGTRTSCKRIVLSL